MSLSSSLAKWCADYTMVFPASAIKSAEVAIADVLGCLLAGRHDPAVISMGKSIKNTPSGRSSSVMHSVGVSASWAAMVNGCAAHALDFDDNFFPAITHASAVLVPALFALAEDIGASPLEITRAYIVGLEVQAQIGKRVNPGHYESGWHATSTIGTIGAAAACANLMKLDYQGILSAISLGSSLASGTKKQFGSMAKPAHAGFAAMHGVLAAELAAAGMTGDEEMLTGPWSFSALYAGSAHHDGSHFGLTELFPAVPLAIEEFGLVAKLYPSCMSSHLAIDALLALRAEHSFKTQDIVSIDLHMPAFMIANLRYQQPSNEMEARFSMNYCAAVTLVHGTPRSQHFRIAALDDPSLHAVLPRVHMHVRAAPLDIQSLPWGGDCVARITLHDGSAIEHRAVYPTGCKQNPLTEVQQRAKFLDCAQSNSSRVPASLLFQRLLEFSSLDAIGEITTALPFTTQQ